MLEQLQKQRFKKETHEQTNIQAIKQTNSQTRTHKNKMEKRTESDLVV